MIEGGQNNAGIPTITHPAYFLANMAPGSTANLFYKTNKSAAVGDRELVLPSGGVLGGGSSTNFMMYSRAQRSDFDAWGMEGWSGEEMVPYLNKVTPHSRPFQGGLEPILNKPCDSDRDLPRQGRQRPPRP